MDDLGACYATCSAGLLLVGTRSRRYYRMAADQGNVDAQYNLGSMYLDGESGDIDIEKGWELLRRAASCPYVVGSSESAAQSSSYIYGHGLDGVAAGLAGAERWKVRPAEIDQTPFRSHPDWFWSCDE